MSTSPRTKAEQSAYSDEATTPNSQHELSTTQIKSRKHASPALCAKAELGNDDVRPAQPPLSHAVDGLDDLVRRSLAGDADVGGACHIPPFCVVVVAEQAGEEASPSPAAGSQHRREGTASARRRRRLVDASVAVAVAVIADGHRHPGEARHLRRMMMIEGGSRRRRRRVMEGGGDDVSQGGRP